MLEKRLYCWVLFFQFMETFKLVFLPFAIIVFIKEHLKLHYLFAASLGNNDWNSYCITSLGKEKTSYFLRSRTNKAWPSELVFCSPCACSHCNNAISLPCQITFPVCTTVYLIARALPYAQVCSALAPAASPLLFPWSFTVTAYHPVLVLRAGEKATAWQSVGAGCVLQISWAGAAKVAGWGLNLPRLACAGTWTAR